MCEEVRMVSLAFWPFLLRSTALYRFFLHDTLLVGTPLPVIQYPRGWQSGGLVIKCP